MTARPLILAFCLSTSTLFAQITSPPAGPAPKPEPSKSFGESFKEVSPGVLQLGLVTLEPVKRLIKIPAVVSVQEGPVGYFLVGQSGKTRESILATTALPDHLQQAMLFLGFREQHEPIPASPNPASLAMGQGVPVRITIHWQTDGKQQEAPAENWVFNSKTQEPMAAVDWLYNTSKLIPGTFVSIMADPSSLINNSRPAVDNQEVWKTRADTVPPVGTPVEVQIQWPEAQTANTPPPSSDTLSSPPASMPPSPNSVPAAP